MTDDFAPLLVIVAIGGIVLYVVMRPNPIVTPPVVAAPQQQCGASYGGTGVSVPCTLLAQGIKDIYNKAQSVLKETGVTAVVTTGTKGFGAVDVVEAPYALNHALYNYAAAGINKLSSIF